MRFSPMPVNCCQKLNLFAVFLLPVPFYVIFEVSVVTLCAKVQIKNIIILL